MIVVWARTSHLPTQRNRSLNLKSVTRCGLSGRSPEAPRIGTDALDATDSCVSFEYDRTTLLFQDLVLLANKETQLLVEVTPFPSTEHIHRRNNVNRPRFDIKWRTI